MLWHIHDTIYPETLGTYLIWTNYSFQRPPSIVTIPLLIPNPSNIYSLPTWKVFTVFSYTVPVPSTYTVNLNIYNVVSSLRLFTDTFSPPRLWLFQSRSWSRTSPEQYLLLRFKIGLSISLYDFRINLVVLISILDKRYHFTICKDPLMWNGIYTFS